MFDPAEDLAAIRDPRAAAACAHLRYVADDRPGIRRQRAGRGWIYRRPDGTRLAEPAALARLRALAIPPAWTAVWICPAADGHLQATGRDARGRKQYRYHPAFREIRESLKYEHLAGFARALPRLRAAVSEHLALPGLPRQKVLATVVRLLESSLIRVGNDDYARHNKSYGLTTLKNRHVAVAGSEIRFRFTGKGGKQWSLTLRDRRIARIVKACQELPGQELLQYVDEAGRLQDVGSADVNAYLREITGEDVTAKDFRTWAGTVQAALRLHELGPSASAAEARRNLGAAIAQVAARLGNTPTICRKCYVHPAVPSCYLEGRLALEIAADEGGEPAGLRPEEAAVMALLQACTQRAAGPAAAPPAQSPAKRRRRSA